jgi:sugar transferase (PEP-CTERM/EpsH1 system associated)
MLAKISSRDIKLGQSDRLLGCLVDDPRDNEHIPTVAALCASSHFAPLDRRVAKITCLRGLLTGDPLSVTFFHDRGLQAWVDGVLRDIRPQAVFICSSNMAPYVLDNGYKAPVRLCDLMDVDSEKWRAYAKQGSGPMRLVHRREWKLTAKLEARISREFDWSTFVSTEEAALFTRLVPGQTGRIRAIGSGVDAVYFDPLLSHEAVYDTQRPNYVFTGTMDYPPNMDAVLWFARSILPMIRKERPDAQFHIVGSSPAPSVARLADLDGVFVTGRVPDVRPYVAHATAGVAPMRIARGIQNKVLEAMAMARPVVVTPDALEGIDAMDGQEVLVASGEAEFANACLAALAPEAQAIGHAARKRVLADYVWAQRLRGFDTLLAQGGP